MTDEQRKAIEWLRGVAVQPGTTNHGHVNVLLGMLYDHMPKLRPPWTVTLHGGPELIQQGLPCANGDDALGCAEQHLKSERVTSVTITKGEDIFPVEKPQVVNEKKLSVGLTFTDHADIARALAMGPSVARWESGGRARWGEFCIGGIRYSTELDQYRASRAHPDTPGGSHEAMSVLNVARDMALQEIG